MALRLQILLNPLCNPIIFLACCCVGEALQGEGSYREAERHFCEAKEWKAAVAMYRSQGAWEDALRVAKLYGGLGAAKQASGSV